MRYTTPSVTDYGRLTEVTAGQADGQALDMAFPVNTPKQDLTFS